MKYRISGRVTGVIVGGVIAAETMLSPAPSDKEVWIQLEHEAPADYGVQQTQWPTPVVAATATALGTTHDTTVIASGHYTVIVPLNIQK